MQFVLAAIVAAVLSLSVAQSAQAESSKAKPAGAHVAISLGDGTTVKGKPNTQAGSVKGSNNSAGGVTIYYNPKEITLDKPVPWTRKK